MCVIADGPTFLYHPRTTSGDRLETITLHCIVDSNPKPQYYWTRGSSMEVSTLGTFIIFHVLLFERSLIILVAIVMTPRWHISTALLPCLAVHTNRPAIMGFSLWRSWWHFIACVSWSLSRFTTVLKKSAVSLGDGFCCAHWCSYSFKDFVFMQKIRTLDESWWALSSMQVLDFSFSLVQDDVQSREQFLLH